MLNSRIQSNTSLGIFSIISESNDQKRKKLSKKIKLIIKIVLLLLSFGLIIYLFINYEKINDLFPYDIYSYIIEKYDSIIIYTKIIDYLSNYHIFIIFFLLGFCQWNIYKSYIHFFGFFILEYTVFLLKFILRKKPLVLDLDINRNSLSDNSLNTLCEFTSEYDCPSYRAAYTIYSYMSFITLLFKEKNLKNKKCIKILLRIFFIIISLVVNASLIILLQNTLSSIIIGSLIGFIIYFFMFSLLKIDYDRSEQMLSFLNFNIIFYIVVNMLLFLILIFLDIFIEDSNIVENFTKLCGESNYNYKKMNSETFYKSLFFFCNLTMIICIKLQRKIIFKTDGYFVSSNFNVSEIIEQNHLMARISNNETYKFNKYSFIKYICKFLICLGISLFVFLMSIIIKYYRYKYYAALSILAYILPINLLVIFLFFFSKTLFIYLDLDIYNENEY